MSESVTTIVPMEGGDFEVFSPGDTSEQPEAQKETAMAESEKKEEARSDSDRLQEFMDSVMKRMDGMEKRFDSMEADRKDRERKDAEEKERCDAEEKARKDAEEKERKDRERKDAARKDGEPERMDGESEDDYTIRLDKYRKDCTARDAEEKERMDKERRDAQEKERADRERHDASDMATLRREIDKLKKLIVTQPTDDDRALIAEARHRVEQVATYFNDSVPTPVPGEDLHSFRRRCARKYQTHAKEFKDVDLLTIPPGPVFDAVESAIYRDAQQAAKSMPGIDGAMRVRRYTDDAGRTVEEVVSQDAAWMDQFTPPSMAVRFNAKGSAQ